MNSHRDNRTRNDGDQSRKQLGDRLNSKAEAGTQAQDDEAVEVLKAFIGQTEEDDGCH